MKLTTLLAVAGSLSLSMALPACASDQAQIGDTTDASTGGTPDGSSANKDGSTTNPGVDSGTTPPLTCSSPCTTDIECQNRCPQLDAGVYCCDLSMVCYPNAASTCPSGSQDGGNLPD